MTAVIERLEPSEAQLVERPRSDEPAGQARDRAASGSWGSRSRLRIWPPAFLTVVVAARRASAWAASRGRACSPASRRCGSPRSGIGLFNALFVGRQRRPDGCPWRSCSARSGSRGRPSLAGVGLAARVIAIAAVGVVFAQTTDSTRLVDSLVQQARVAGAVRVRRAGRVPGVPRLADQLATLRQARRIRGLRWSWHPRLLVGLLVLAIRHGDRLALAMDARAFGSGPRSRYRVVRWTWLDLAVAVGRSWCWSLPSASADPSGGASLGRVTDHDVVRDRLAATTRVPADTPRPLAGGDRPAMRPVIRQASGVRGTPTGRPTDVRSSARLPNDRASDERGASVADGRTIVFFPEGAYGPTNNCVGHRRRAAAPRPPGRVHRRGVVRGQPRGQGVRGAADAARPAAGGARGPGPVLDRLHPRHGAGLPQVDARADRRVHPADLAGADRRRRSTWTRASSRSSASSSPT